MAIRLPNWEDQIHDIAVQFMNATVQFYTVLKNPTGAPDEIVLWEGKARVQHLRAPREQETAYASTGSRMFRFQLDPDDEPPFFDEGTYARVLDGARDPDLELLVYKVTSSINSSHRAVRTVELRADMNQVEQNRVTGVVVDEDSEMPLEGVEVRVVDDSGRVRSVVFTGSGGKFYSYLVRSGSYDLEFVFDNYQTVTVDSVQNGDEVFVEMIQNG